MKKQRKAEMAKIIDGKIISEGIKQEIKTQVLALKEKGVTPSLTVIVVGNNPASAAYIKGKQKDCEECGINSQIIALPETTAKEEIIEKVKELNKDDTVNGILVQLPLPEHINSNEVISVISPQKDVDGFTTISAGNLMLGTEGFRSCTPAGVILMLKKAEVEISGKHCVVIGRSNIVGKPLAVMLIEENATVTVCHSKTINIKEMTLQADILISAVGKQGFVTRDMVKQGAVVVDIGINRNEEGKLCGDVSFEEVSEVASAITPVPGGVGLMTRVVLLQNTIKATLQQNNICITN